MMKSTRRKVLSNKQKQQMLKEDRLKKQEKQNNDVNISDAPKTDPKNFFLKFINDSDAVVNENKIRASDKFNYKKPMYKINQLVYLQEECCPELPLRPVKSDQMDKPTYEKAEKEVFENYFKQISPNLQQIATQFCQFEVNKNVYCEAWRVTERAHVVCVLTDSRFPLAHVPINFINYFKNCKKPVILMMNKKDLVSTIQIDQWTSFFVHFFKHKKIEAEIICYSAMELQEKPETRSAFLNTLVSLARKLTKREAPEEIGIGFMGQPSVGKSKTMNALLGKKVTAVRLTAGCTKHLQSYFLEKEELNNENETNRSVIFLDCPGLVVPVKGAPRPLQIVTGVFPIGRVREFYSPVRLLCEYSECFTKQVTKQIDFPMICRRYQLDESQYNAEQMDTPIKLLDSLAYNHGYLCKGNSAWQHKAGFQLIRRVCEGSFVYEIPVGKEVAELLPNWVDKWQGQDRVVHFEKMSFATIQNKEDLKEQEAGEEFGEEFEE